MDDSIKDLVESKNKLFLKNKKYLEDNDWADVEVKTKPKSKSKVKKVKPKEDENYSIAYKKTEFKIQNEIVKGMIQHVKRFLKRIKGVDIDQSVQDFLDSSLSVIELHTNRVDFYVDTIDVSEIDDMDIRVDELQFHNEISKEVEAIQDAVTLLGLRDSKIADTSAISFRDDKPLPLSMLEIAVRLYPEIGKKLEEKEIDFHSPPNNEMLIYMEDVPEWDRTLHFYQQKTATLQFYVDEMKKLKQGISIDGVYISGWAYYHINVFKTNIPIKTWNELRGKYVSKDNIISPPLRDSDWMVFENRKMQEDLEIPFMFISATRRAAKTTLEASMLGHAATIGMKELLCAGANSKDLGQLAKNFKTDLLNKNPAFAVYNESNDWTKIIEMGIKRKDGQTIVLSTLNIINTDDGNNKEVFAGFTPDLMVLDEAMKAKFLESLEGILPAMVGDDGTIRCYGMLSGTGGDAALSADGFKALSDPETYDILPMQWDILERGIPKHLITWEEDRNKPFGTFIPGQCRVDMPKVEKTLAEYLERPEAKGLQKIKVKVTDWDKANGIIKDKRNKITKDKVKLNKEIIYCPIKPSEIFMSGKMNRFPVEVAKAHRDMLLETGIWDRRRELYRDDDGKIHATSSNKPLAPFPHKGGLIDAPFLIFEDIPEIKPIYGMYSGGFDDYASDDSETSSLGTFYVMKNEVIGDPFSNKIVASISCRPPKHSDLWEKWLLLMEAYNLDQTAFGENFNYGIKDFLDRRKLSEKYLAPGLDFSTSFNLPNNQKRTTGWNPRTSKSTLFDLLVDYCNETYEIEQPDGSIKLMLGVQLIDDIGALEEIIQWNENLNVDRLTSLMGCISYNHFLRVSNRWKPLRIKQKQETNTPLQLPQERKMQMYNTSRKRTFYTGRR